VNIRFGKTLTHLPVLPKNARRTMKDPFAPKRPLWFQILSFLFTLALIALALWKLGFIQLPF